MVQQRPSYLDEFSKNWHDTREADRAARDFQPLPAHVSIGGNVFTLINSKGEDVASGTPLDGIVAYIRPKSLRTYYAKPYVAGQAGEPPTCVSYDGVAPDQSESLNPQSERCSDCEWNAWGSGPGGSGKKCATRRSLVLMTPDGMFWYMTISSGSLKAWKSYVDWLERDLEGAKPHEVVTRFSFVPKVNGVLQFDFVRYAERDELGIMSHLSFEAAENVCGPLSAINVRLEDFSPSVTLTAPRKTQRLPVPVPEPEVLSPDEPEPEPKLPFEPEPKPGRRLPRSAPSQAAPPEAARRVPPKLGALPDIDSLLGRNRNGS